MLMALAGWAIERAMAAVPQSSIAERRAIAPERLPPALLPPVSCDDDTDHLASCWSENISAPNLFDGLASLPFAGLPAHGSTAQPDPCTAANNHGGGTGGTGGGGGVACGGVGGVGDAGGGES